MDDFPRPRVLVSRCLGFAPCRYDGQVLANDFADKLAKHCRIITVCPEADTGLGIPRPPIRLCRRNNAIVVYQPATDTDVTDQVMYFTRCFLDELKDIDGVLLKGKSPACALRDARIYQGVQTPVPAGKTGGFFGREIRTMFEDQAAMDDELRLTNSTLRDHFLIQLYTRCRFRHIAGGQKTTVTPAMGDLVRFHSRHKLLFLSYNERQFRLAGKIVANHERLPVEEVFALYEKKLRLILQRPFAISQVVNSLYHAFGWISEHLSAKEKQHTINAIEEYRDERLPLSTVAWMLKAHALRFQHGYLLSQFFLAPYPKELASLKTSGKGRKIL